MMYNYNIKNELIYNYSFRKPAIKKQKDGYLIYENGKKYILYEVIDEKKFESIYEIIEKNENLKKIYKIIKTLNNNILIKYHYKSYFMMEKMNISELEIKQIINKNIYIEDKKILNQSNLKEIWTNKIDCIERIYSKIKNKENKNILELIDYAILMTEVAIMYTTDKKTSAKQVISYKKIDIESMTNPQNIIIDKIERNISNQLKQNYLIEKHTQTRIQKVEEILEKYEKKDISYNELFARLIYPEIIYDFIREYYKKNKIFDIRKYTMIKRQIEDYEKYISYIYKKMYTKHIKKM